jgi:hypothetical protein
VSEEVPAEPGPAPGEVPDWLSRLAAEPPENRTELPLGWEPGEREEPEEGDQEPGLAHADLPSWLEAMRPVEDFAPTTSFREESTGEAESAGPLAGLRGVLSAEPEIARLQKPPTYSLKLRITGTQQAHADLLKALLTEEGEARPVPRRPAISSQHLLRWGVGLVLFLSILWPLITASRQAPLPSFPIETAQVNDIIDQLPAEARALLVFDYEPGFSGEMDASAAAVVDHLLLRGAYLTLVSTSPTGPVLAEHFLAGPQALHEYTRNVQYVNLGFIPGGPAGLLSFAENPQRTLPFTLDGVSAWTSASGAALPPLEDIRGIGDFSLVMVLVDDPLAARAWVEQVQPRLVRQDRQTPLVMVVSAQAEPLVRPFYEASPRQIQGMVAGLRGGAAYASLTGRDNLGGLYWDAFGAGISVAALMILIGGLIGGFSGILNRRASLQGEERP